MQYKSLLGYLDGARRLHIHETVIEDTSTVDHYQHKHKAEEAFYILEGSAEYTFDGSTQQGSPGDLIFIPSGVMHAEIKYLTPSMKYLTIRSVEENDESCCCGGDKCS